MKPGLVLSSRAIVVASALLASAGAATELTVATGPRAGVYWAMTQDLAALVAADNVVLAPKESPGSLANLYALRFSPGVQLAFVQADVVDFVAKARDAAEPAEAARIDAVLDAARIVSVLHGEEVHLLARREIASIADLRGKRVAIGAGGSGASLTAEKLFDLIDVEVEFVRDIDAVTSLEYLRFGEVDAFIMVVGQPAPLFAQGVAPHENIHILPLDDPRLLAHYQPALIDPDSYPWLDEPVQTVSVRALLMAFPYTDPDVCAAIRALAGGIATQLGALRDRGHPEWEDVAAGATTTIAKPHPCLAGGTGPTAATPRQPPTSTALAAPLADPAPLAVSAPEPQGDAGLLNDLMR